MEDDLKTFKIEYLSNAWSYLPQILILGLVDQTQIKMLEMKTTSNGIWPKNIVSGILSEWILWKLHSKLKSFLKILTNISQERSKGKLRVNLECGPAQPCFSFNKSIRSCRWGAEWRVPRARTRERGPLSAWAEISNIKPLNRAHRKSIYIRKAFLSHTWNGSLSLHWNGRS